MKVRNTEQLLLCLSYHLYNAPACKGAKYVAKIGKDGDISFEPNVYVFQDTHHRKPEDKVRVLFHVLTKHCSHLLDYERTMKDDMLRLKVDDVVPGTYQYRYYFGRKRRQWIRVE